MLWSKGEKGKISTDAAKIEALLSRGVENIFPNRGFLESKLKKGEKLSLYLGIDPTGPTLHIGHLVPIRKLSEFQKLGHKVILLIGDFTATIGDPTDKTATRQKLSHKEVMENCREYKKQIGKFLEFSGPNPVEMRFNSQWLAKMTFAEILELASLVTVDQMLKRDMFAKRNEEGKPIYLHEFLYPLMQGYDSVAMDVDGEVGGNDQTFNMLTGRGLVKSINQKEKFVLAVKLLTDPTGKKMGKSEGNMVALNQTPEDMFGKVMSWNDELIIPGFEILTDVPLSEIESMKDSLAKGSNPKEFKVRLAKEIISSYHGKDAALKAEKNFENTFTKGGVPEDVLKIHISETVKIPDQLVELKIVESKTDLRRLIDAGAVSSVLSGKKIESVDELEKADTLKIGKHRFVEIKEH